LGALFFYLKPIWDHEFFIESLNHGILLTGIALSFASLARFSKKLDITKKGSKLMLVVLGLSVALLFGMAAVLFFTFDGAQGLSQSLFVLAIGMLSYYRMIVACYD
jgi:NO-binding membrane sensor protein with MHYT domain